MKILLSLCLVLISSFAFGQADQSKTLDQRARDFHRAISKNNKTEWRHYMTENFTQALIDRPMRAKVVTSESDNASSASTTTETEIEAKLTMFERLHQDFGKGKITSVKLEGSKVVMTVSTDHGLTGVFHIEAESNSPWKIDKLGIEVEASN